MRGWCFFLLVALSPWLVGAQEPLDLVLRGGRIVDGTGNPWFIGDVGIRGDRIAELDRRIETPTKREIDVRGLIVSPGFIDIHSHSDYFLLEDGRALSKVTQGVTTEVLGEGNSPGPYSGKLGRKSANVGGKTIQWSSLADYFDLVDRTGISVNVASYVGLNNVWQCVMGKSFAHPEPEQVEEMKALVQAAMEEGALGLSSQVMMPPGSLATTNEIIELCEVVARYQGVYSTHIRNEGTGVFESVKEAIKIGEQAGVPVDVIHLKIADQKYWGRMDEVVKLIEQARRRGIDVQANVYPYTRGNNNLVSIIPPWAHEGGTEKLLERLRDPKERERMKKDIRGEIPGWYNHLAAVGGDWSRILVSGESSVNGLKMDRVMALRTKGEATATKNIDPLDELFDLLLEEGGSIGAVYAHHTEEDMNLALRQSWCSIGSDGSAYAVEGALRKGNPHPRNFGTFPRVLGVYVRDRQMLGLEDAVRKMTSLNANRIGLRDRGILREDAYADITVFDPQQVIDRSTYTDPFQYSEGIRYVIVNGTMVLKDGEHTGAKPGRSLRRL
jgi:N-acyl-D-aspartate/D-glutamate deacylase